MGFEKEILRAGTGPKPTKGQKVTVHCTGYEKQQQPSGAQGHGASSSQGAAATSQQKRKRGVQHHGKDRDLSKKFWSTKDPGQQPFSFNIGLGSVIKGWDEGVMTMQVGEVARIQCTPDYAYGASGFPAWGIQPNSVLVFEIEVLSAQ
ncbi:peptidyl-prolyl cis-trans isomerase FKBP12-like isoform X1 [Panicum virgatum]|uniref:peptidyl-prolyl cis-trans isomerase FKBP12-like isoform X1 n=1 Tax=Panicum virgatum TaxID=38727 RepID=UPI0002A9C82D|nr:peptidyl-prolyl cis-trans isomerase FKBP12-like isoform X1 [Panicum virgatum]